MFVILKLLRVSGMPKGDEWMHVSLVEEIGVTKDGIVRLNALVKCLYCDKRYSGGAVRIRSQLAGTACIGVGPCPGEYFEIQSS